VGCAVDGGEGEGGRGGEGMRGKGRNQGWEGKRERGWVGGEARREELEWGRERDDVERGRAELPVRPRTLVTLTSLTGTLLESMVVDSLMCVGRW